ncbi:conjugal transfer protein TraD [Sphingobacterium humi]|uniref:conjugal transfer protein TraD n=1 Tax=Sphingobacterium humi TaxID=1796905 RepID=UPI0031B6005D
MVKPKTLQPAEKPDLPEIMGKPKPIARHIVPTDAPESRTREQDDIPDTFDTETRTMVFAKEVPQEELDDVFGSIPDFDFEKEEEEWKAQVLPDSDNGFATGVTYEELATVGALLKQDILKPASQQKAVDIVQQIQGTELFSLLESSMEGASQKIATLLDQSLSTKADVSSSDLRKSDVEGFDIGKFV